jgi:hypothetical protein
MIISRLGVQIAPEPPRVAKIKKGSMQSLSFINNGDVA